MTVQEIEEILQNTALPNTIMLNQATTVTDVNGFIETNLPRAKNWPGELKKCPSYWHLLDLVKALKELS